METKSASDVDKAMADLARCGREIEEAGKQLRASVSELQGAEVVPIRSEPEAEVSLTRGELDALIDRVEIAPVDSTSATNAAYDKLVQARAIESGPGGRFRGDAA